jgi:hypothetical protein
MPAMRDQIAELRARIIVLEGRSPVPLTLPPGEGFGRVASAVAAEFGVTLEDLLGERRHAPIAEARQVAMALGQRCCGYSLPRIGRLLRRDHTTVLHGIRTVARRCAEDPDFAARLDRLAADIKAQQRKERVA